MTEHLQGAREGKTSTSSPPPSAPVTLGESLFIQPFTALCTPWYRSRGLAQVLFFLLHLGSLYLPLFY